MLTTIICWNTNVQRLKYVSGVKYGQLTKTVEETCQCRTYEQRQNEVDFWSFIFFHYFVVVVSEK